MTTRPHDHMTTRPDDPKEPTMDFTLPLHLEPILERVRRFVDEELIPLEPDFLNREFRDLLPTLAE